VRFDANVSLSDLMVKKRGEKLQSELSALQKESQFVSRVGEGVQEDVEVVVEGVLDGVEVGSSGQWLLEVSCGPLQGSTEQHPVQATSG
jgi:hypothetical protein